jgi:hypothetical protein
MGLCHLEPCRGERFQGTPRAEALVLQLRHLCGRLEGEFIRRFDFKNHSYLSTNIHRVALKVLLYCSWTPHGLSREVWARNLSAIALRAQRRGTIRDLGFWLWRSQGVFINL